MAAFLRQAARRIGRSVLQRTHAAVTAPAVVEERRRLVTRRLYTTHGGAPQTREEYLQEKYGHLNAFQKCWMFINLFPVGKVLGLLAMPYVAYSFISAARELELERKEAEKQRKQSASTELKPQEADTE